VSQPLFRLHYYMAVSTTRELQCSATNVGALNIMYLGRAWIQICNTHQYLIRVFMCAHILVIVRVNHPEAQTPKRAKTDLCKQGVVTPPKTPSQLCGLNKSRFLAPATVICCVICCVRMCDRPYMSLSS